MKCCLLLLVLWLPLWGVAAPLTLVAGDFSPYTGESLPQGGLSTRLVRAVFEEAGWEEPNIAFMPWSRGYKQARLGIVAATFPYAWNAERAGQFLYSAPIHFDHLLWFSRKENKKAAKGEWKGMRLCIPKGWNTAHAAEAIKRYSLRLEQPLELERCLELVMVGRADLIAMNERVIGEACMQEFRHRECLQRLPFYPQTDSFYLIMSRSYPDAPAFIERFNTALASLRADGRYDRILLEGFAPAE
ncbi:ABC transporter substrate-binding protein [Aeromonas schubertii]|uniref:substrate-binding periplasmic protein n=1 Tax=Aeromonas TaxID=642 RepID=UPI0010A91893|nr:ABC transporter substrate-binding protein [Aeromonas schubertii]QCG46828.1 ABC transporter substrate-binding protein [Aeromonas schubertii]